MSSSVTKGDTVRPRDLNRSDGVPSAAGERYNTTYMTYLLFDLGHVLVDLNGMPWLRRHWSGCDDSEVHRRWLGLEPVQKYERGRIGSKAFFSRMPMALSTDLTPGEFEAIFDSWMVGAYAGAEALLQSLRGSYRLGCLSNTNPCHIAKLRSESSLLDAFDDCFLSYGLDLVPPVARRSLKKLQGFSHVGVVVPPTICPSMERRYALLRGGA